MVCLPGPSPPLLSQNASHATRSLMDVKLPGSHLDIKIQSDRGGENHGMAFGNCWRCCCWQKLIICMIVFKLPCGREPSCDNYARVLIDALISLTATYILTSSLEWVVRFYSYPASASPRTDIKKRTLLALLDMLYCILCCPARGGGMARDFLGHFSMGLHDLGEIYDKTLHKSGSKSILLCMGSGCLTNI
jgi:hypothetical protein